MKPPWWLWKDLACQAGAPCPWLVLNTSHQSRQTQPQSTLEEGAATEPWMPEAAAAWEVDGAGRSPASLLSGKKGTLPSSKLAMVVSTQLVWTVGTKGPVRNKDTPNWLPMCSSAAGTTEGGGSHIPAATPVPAHPGLS